MSASWVRASIGVAAVWTLVKIAGPVIGGIRSSFAASRARGRTAAAPLEERDLPFGVVVGGSLLVLVPIAALLWSTIAGGPLQGSALVLIAGALVFVLVVGLVIAAVCGYMAALIGASNSPVSGIGILSVLAASLMLVGLFGRGTPAGTTEALVAYALIVTGVVVRRRDDLERQPPGPEDRPTGRCDAVEAAGGAAVRRRLRQPRRATGIAADDDLVRLLPGCRVPGRMRWPRRRPR